MASPVNSSGTGFLFCVELPCELGAVRTASLQARDFLAGHGTTPPDLLACELALVEACNNAVLYANPNDQKPILIQLLKEGLGLEMQVIDHTPGFDWPSDLQLPEPEAEHGRGLFIIQS